MGPVLGLVSPFLALKNIKLAVEKHAFGRSIAVGEV